MEVLQKSLNICHIPYWFPSTVALTISYAIDQIVDLVANNLGIKDGSNLVLRSIFKFDLEWRWYNTVGIVLS